MTSKGTRTKAVTLSPYTMRRHRAELDAWLRQIDVDPATVSVDHPIQIADGKVKYLSLSADAGGEPSLCVVPGSPPADAID